MMYAVYRCWGDEPCFGRDLMFVTADERVAEDTVALAELEQEEARAIPYPRRKNDSFDSLVLHNQEITEYEAKVKSILTVDPEGLGSDIDYSFEEVEVR